MEEIQQNYNEKYVINNEDIQFNIKALPYTFYNDFNKYKNNGNKIICPKHILYKISNYENVCFPITFKIKDTYLGVLEFVEFIDAIYIPNDLFYSLDLTENTEIELNLLHKNIEKGSMIKIKPQNDDFYFIEDKKKYLEIHLKNLFNTITKNTIISIPYKDFTIPFLVTDCLPNDTISLVDIDELEVDIEPINEPNMKIKTEHEPQQENEVEPKHKVQHELENKNSKFPGKARTLND